jgi:methyl-accepting chemotaxis protein
MSVATALNGVSIRAKITSIFAVLLAMVGGLGIIALTCASRTNDVVQDLNANYVPSLVYLESMQSIAKDYFEIIAKQVMQNDGSGVVQNNASRLNDLQRRYELEDAKYAPTATTPEERAIYARIVSNWKSFLAHATKLRAVLESGDIATAKIIYVTDLEPASIGTMAAIRDDFRYNAKEVGTLAAAATESFNAGRRIVIALMGAVVLVAVLGGYALIASIARPITLMTSAMGMLAVGDTTIMIPARDRGDEVGRMAAAVEVFKQGMIDADALRAEQEALKISAAADQQAAMHRMADGFERRVGVLVQVLATGATELRATAQSLTGMAEQSSLQANTVSASADEASMGVQTVSAAAEELSASISEISRQVSQSARMTAKAVSDAQRTDAIVRALAEGAQKIGDVVGLITSIAGQTNLLALNATIEAARAGDAGKGFAVVASEVKSLANQTGRATEEIAAQITQIQNATKEAVEAIRGIAETIEQVSAIATTIASAVEEQGAATAEIARNVQQTAHATREVTVNIGGMSQAASETGQAASQVLSVATDVSHQAENLSTEVGGFVAEVRAA